MTFLSHYLYKYRNPISLCVTIMSYIQKMAKGGYSGGKAGGGAKCAGKGSSYKGSSTYGGLGAGRSYGKGYKIGTDGSALMPNYMGGKGKGKVLGDYLKQAYGMGILSESMKTGQPFSNGMNPGYEQSLFDKKVDDVSNEMSRYRNIDESDENEKPCGLCGGPALKGSPFCVRCVAGLN